MMTATAEHDRLEQASGEVRSVETVGAIFKRAAMEHGARGLQPVRRCMEPFHPRSGALPRVPLGRRRPRRHFRRQAAALLRIGAVERLLALSPGTIDDTVEHTIHVTVRTPLGPMAAGYGNCLAA